MATTPSLSLSLFSLFFFLLTLYSSGTELGFSIDARESISASSITKTLSFLELNKVSRSRIRVFVSDFRVLSELSNSGVSVDLYLNENLINDFIASKSSAISWLKSHVVTLNIKSITLKCSDFDFDLSKLLNFMKLIHSSVRTYEIRVSVAFSMEFLENLGRNDEIDLFRVLGFIRKTMSFVIVEGGFDDHGVKVGNFDSLMKSKLCDVDIVMTVKSVFDQTENVVEFGDRLLKSVANSPVSGRIVGFYVELESVADKEQKREHEQIFPSFRRELKNSVTVSRDSVTIPPDDSPTPNIVTVPATNPVTITPNVPASTPLPIPSTTPVIVPPTNPSVNPPAPITNPVTTPVPGGQPITNPVTTFPSPQPGNVPVTNPVAPPAPTTTNAPVVAGQSWCVAKTGATESVVQSGLDYACGMGGADCSQIQQGGNCYNPNTLLNHASFAFNSYYQKNPVATSCDFGGAASLVSTNPSTGSCIFPLSSSSSTSTSTSPPSPPSTSLPPPTTPTTNPSTTPSTTNPTNPTTTPITTNPTTPITNPTTTPSTPITGDPSGNVTPPSVLNSSSPSTDFGFATPPGLSSSTSKTVALQPLFSCIIIVAFFFARTMILDM
ncbi:uncharacterized protein [Euphorbia lathyris]|uniref:uncharacterized protein n=1 Tax=Euphorbia lathyris TaxID=212925 RepID=UPI00331408E2